MKKLINRNFLWSQLFVEQLIHDGVKNVCISPGSRSTSLTLAFAKNKKIKKYVIPDERTNGFFALGLASKLNRPVAIVTTSGTATAELYPAIIEAYQRRIPLIICTADRPPELQKCGANQTINQKNIYKNHIRKFIDLGLPSVNVNKLIEIQKAVHHAVEICTLFNRGPVHLNFPFRKPFEPETFTDKIDRKIYNKLFANFISLKTSKLEEGNSTTIAKLINKINNISKGLIICGSDNYDKSFYTLCSNLSKKTGFPILADGNSGIRFGNYSNKLVVCNSTSILKSNTKRILLEAEVIIQFGGFYTSNALIDFIGESKAAKFSVNSFGDYRDPTKTTKSIIKKEPNKFCVELLKSNLQPLKNKKWVNSIIKIENFIESEKSKFMDGINFYFEGKITTEVLKLIPPNSNLMISNSMPIRDLDFYASKSRKKINLFSNRGASGIDGIISTAAGIAVKSTNPTFLITGDLAFYHDMNGLYLLKTFQIPLIIILIDNNGGGIFNLLPISNYENEFVKYFQTPLNVDLLKFVKAYGGNAKKITNLKEFRKNFKTALKRKKFTVLQIKTNAVKSTNIRNKYWETISHKIDKLIDVS